MSSIAFVDGFYYVPRIDREIIKKYKEDIIVLTGNLRESIELFFACVISSLSNSLLGKTFNFLRLFTL